MEMNKNPNMKDSQELEDLKTNDYDLLAQEDEV